jgi:hypothetical protein
MDRAATNRAATNRAATNRAATGREQYHEVPLRCAFVVALPAGRGSESALERLHAPRRLRE